MKIKTFKLNNNNSIENYVHPYFLDMNIWKLCTLISKRIETKDIWNYLQQDVIWK